MLIDYVDFVVHVFSEKARKFYDLERLWKSASAGARRSENRGPGEEDSDEDRRAKKRKDAKA